MTLANCLEISSGWLKVFPLSSTMMLRPKHKYWLPILWWNPKVMSSHLLPTLVVISPDKRIKEPLFPMGSRNLCTMMGPTRLPFNISMTKLFVMDTLPISLIRVLDSTTRGSSMRIFPLCKNHSIGDIPEPSPQLGREIQPSWR